MQKLSGLLWLIVFLSPALLLIFPQQCATSVQRRTERNITETSTSVSVSVRKIIRIRGPVSGKKNQERRSLLQSDIRRNKKLWEKLKHNKLHRARKYKKFEDRNKITNNKLKKVNNNIDDENPHYGSNHKTLNRRIKYRTSKNPYRRRNSTIPVKPTPTAPSARLHQYLNSPETFQLNSAAEANYVALRRNIKPNRPKVTTETAARKPKSIKLLVGNMIDQLKADLDNLLRFNGNTLHYDKSIVKDAAKTKVEDFFDSLSNAIDTQTKVKPNCSSSKKESLEAASNILNVTEDISRTLASTLTVGSVTEIKLANISMAVMKKKLSDSTSSAWETGDVKVTLPDQENIAEDNSSISVSFTSYHNLGSMMNQKDDIRSPVLSVNVVRNHNQNQKRSIPLTKPIEFLLHHKPFKRVRKKKCVFWDFKYAAWSKDGCYTLRKKSTATTTACQCYHLTNFALKLEDEDEDIEEIEDTTILPPKLKFGDKLFPEKVNTIVKEEKSKFQVHITPKPVIHETVTYQQGLPVLNTRTALDTDYEYYWEEFEKEEENKLWDELPSEVENIQEYEALKIFG